MKDTKGEKITDPFSGTAITGVFIGALLLAGLSFIQKIISGYNPYMWKGYIIPLFFGGFSGLFVGIHIHKLRKSLRALRLSEDKYRVVADFTFDWEYWADPDGNFVYVSPSCEKISGYKARDFMNDPSLFLSLVHPDDFDKVKSHLVLVRRSTSTYNIDFRIIDSDGNEHWMHHNCQPVYNSKGYFLGRRGNNHDFTAQKRAENAALAHAERFRVFFSSINDAILVHPLKEKGFAPFVEVNDIACKRYGYSREEFLKLTAADITIKSDAQKYGKYDNRNALHEKRHIIFEVIHIKKTGETFPVEINSNIVYQYGEPYILTVVRDITERRQAEQEQRFLERKLAQAQKMEAIGNLAGGIAHDFNNILAAMLGYAELLRLDLPDDSIEFKNAGKILRAGNRAKHLVHQILTFSRRTEYELKPVDLYSIIKDTTDLLRSSLPSTITIKKNIENNSIVMGDATKLQQILMNLCTNAAHAMWENGGILTIELKKIELKESDIDEFAHLSPGPYAQLSVSDTGDGIPEKYINRIFEPFFTTKKIGEGTGMGLSIVHGIVESFKGKIHVYSHDGEGTTFDILLPSNGKNDEQIIQKADELKKGTEHILFLDDEPVLVELAELQLKSFGYRVSSSSDSLEALALFKNKPDSFDLVITDMTMPDMTGDKLAQEIKKIKPDIPIILCTGFSSENTREREKNFCVDTLLIKPVEMNKMLETIRELLDRIDKTPKKIILN